MMTMTESEYELEPRARVYANARGVKASLKPSMPYTIFSVSFNLMLTASFASARETCLKEAAAGILNASCSALTRA